MAESVLDIKVNDAEFKAFEEAFNKYNEKLAKQPSAWAAVSKENKQVETSFRSMTAALMAQADIMRREAKSARDVEVHTSAISRLWDRISTRSRDYADNVTRGTRWLLNLRHSATIGILGALAGFGGSIWGLEHLAYSASSGRRAATGTGTSYGEHTAFGSVFGRYLDTGAFLGSISQARSNLASPAATALSILGVNRSGTTMGMTRSALGAVYDLVQRTPQDQLGLLLQTHKLGELGLSDEDLNRFKGMSREEFNSANKQLGAASNDLNVTDPILRKWQQFTVQLDLAGQKIKSVLIDSLSGLTEPLSRLTEGFSNLVKSLLGSKGFKDGVNYVADTLNDFAKYVQKDEFKRDLRDLVNGIGSLAKAVGDALRFLGVLPSAGQPGGPPAPTKAEWDAATEKRILDNPGLYNTEEARARYRNMRNSDYNQLYGNAAGVQGAVGGVSSGAVGGGVMGAFSNTGSGSTFLGGVVGNTSINNPGNIRGLGGKGFLQFSSPQGGVIAARNNLNAYMKAGWGNNIQDIISHWAPPNENNTAAYIKNMAQWTGYGATQQIDLKDPQVMASILSGIFRQEGTRHQYSPQQVRVILENNTGGNTITSSAQMGSSSP